MSRHTSNTTLILLFSMVFSQWSTDMEQPVEVSSWGVCSMGCTDGSGGAFVLWSGGSYESNRIYMRRVNNKGFVQWDDYINVGGTGDTQECHAFIIEDGEGGAIVGFNDKFESGYIPPYIVYSFEAVVQRVDSLGNKLWGENGLEAFDSSWEHVIHGIVSDGAGGAIIVSSFFNIPDGWLGSDSSGFAVQRISHDGELLWGNEGVVIRERLPTASFPPLITGNGQGGALVLYTNNTGPVDYHLVHVDLDGNVTDNLIWSFPYLAYWRIHYMISDGNGGCIIPVIITDYPYHLKIFRLSNTGEFLWGEDGVEFEDLSLSSAFGPTAVILNSDNSTTLAWGDTTQNYTKIMTNRISGEGIVMWENSMKVSTYPSNTGLFANSIVAAENGATIYLLTDDRYTPEGEWELGLIVQKISAAGERLWGDSAVVVVNPPSGNTIHIISDSNGGCLVIYNDEPFSSVNIHQINRYGHLGTALPIEYLPGDINDDSTVNVSDVVLFVDWIMNATPLTDENLLITDMNQDYQADILDIVMLVMTILS